MKTTKIILALMFLFGATLGNTAWAYGHGHGHVGVYVGVPLFSPWYYPAPYYGPPYYGPYYNSATVVTQPAPVYIEQAPDSAPVTSASSNAWYYCNNPDGYYPYVKSCPGGWQKVAPHP